ncbi:MAG: hypothetical protein C0425_02970 [Chlorobiaceae bacterium]|nr:hypothetical protein [Chlorobiaceae bacterium]MBA4309281.1 hypothetical protein [Chlorobiaceae bacterium]
MSKLKKLFTEKEWKECCGTECKSCRIFSTYKSYHGKTKAKKNFSSDHKKLNEKKIVSNSN